MKKTALFILLLALCLLSAPFAVAERFWKYRRPVKPDPVHRAIYDQKYRHYCLLRQLYRDTAKAIDAAGK